MKTIGFAAQSAGAPLSAFNFERRTLHYNDVLIEILFCGVCHSDLHFVRNDWGNSVYPCVPGHEIVGRVIETGRDVKRFKDGDHVAVGCLVDSCRHCDKCHRGEENYCRQGFTGTYNAPDRITGENTMGGYSKHVVVHEDFVLQVSGNLELAKAAPLLCAGITTYSPLRTFNAGPGSRVGVVGLGGLGHMAVKLAAAMGAFVTVVSRSQDKLADALELGADALLVSSDVEAMEKAANGFDIIIDTIPVKHDMNPYLPLLDIDGTLVIVGQIGPMAELTSIPLLFGRRRVTGSLNGSIAETQEMLDFCARKNILPDVEMIRIDQIAEAFERMERSDIRYRFVIDMASLEIHEANVGKETINSY